MVANGTMTLRTVSGQTPHSRCQRHFNSPPDETSQTVLNLVEHYCADHFGELDEFGFAVTREQALQVLEHFIVNRLPLFGTFQDAMIEGEPWMYHSHIGFYLNVGLLGPGEVITSVQNAYEAGTAPLNSVEGFIRQILGWREFVRGIYWLKMPGYASENFFLLRTALFRIFSGQAIRR